MPNKSLSRSGLLTYQKYSSLLAGNNPYIPVPPSDYDLLETEILTGTQASVIFSSLNSTYGADYQHLQIRVASKTNRADSEDIARVAINNTYNRSHYLQGTGVSVQSGSETSPYYRSWFTSGATGTAIFGGAVIDILDPFETTKNTTIRTFSGFENSTADKIAIGSTAYYSTSATDSIKFEAIGSWVSGCRFSLYGLKASA